MGKKNIKYKIKNELVDLSFLLPAFLVFLFMILIPLIMGVRFTFTDWDGISDTMNFVGLKNFNTVFHDKDLLVPIKNTIIFTIITVICVNAIGLGLALLVNREFKGINIFKSIIFIPLVISLVLVSQMWMYVYNDFFDRVGKSFGKFKICYARTLWNVYMEGVWTCYDGLSGGTKRNPI